MLQQGKIFIMMAEILADTVTIIAGRNFYNLLLDTNSNRLNYLHDYLVHQII